MWLRRLLLSLWWSAHGGGSSSSGGGLNRGLERAEGLLVPEVNLAPGVWLAVGSLSGPVNI